VLAAKTPFAKVSFLLVRFLWTSKENEQERGASVMSTDNDDGFE
jgi:hypothetical protein